MQCLVQTHTNLGIGEFQAGDGKHDLASSYQNIHRHLEEERHTVGWIHFNHSKLILSLYKDTMVIYKEPFQEHLWRRTYIDTIITTYRNHLETTTDAVSVKNLYRELLQRTFNQAMTIRITCAVLVISRLVFSNSPLTTMVYIAPPSKCCSNEIG